MLNHLHSCDALDANYHWVVNGQLGGNYSLNELGELL